MLDQFTVYLLGLGDNGEMGKAIVVITWTNYLNNDIITITQYGELPYEIFVATIFLRMPIKHENLSREIILRKVDKLR